MAGWRRRCGRRWTRASCRRRYATAGCARRRALTRTTRAQRDEAIRSASLATMVLLLAAEERGLASCALGGFDAEAVAREFDLAADELPVMLVTVGRAAAGNWPQKPRRPVAEVMVLA
ncbi:nitroreductase family protein [Chromobacterium haemolyticum]|uniref:nitroreductase family protein n=1 Tax=Chromobacterium haemolyticum TaxID=394935 RepID=UPI0018DCA24E|nr:nitroreductase family protein [Chromobacterium haemolyticum]